MITEYNMLCVSFLNLQSFTSFYIGYFTRLLIDNRCVNNCRSISKYSLIINLINSWLSNYCHYSVWVIIKIWIQCEVISTILCTHFPQYSRLSQTYIRSWIYQTTVASCETTSVIRTYVISSMLVGKLLLSFVLVGNHILLNKIIHLTLFILHFLSLLFKHYRRLLLLLLLIGHFLTFILLH